MKETVLRKQGKDLVLDAPSELKDCVGRKYNIIENADGSILYKPIGHVNVFSTPAFRDHDFNEDVRDFGYELKPVGKEKLLW